MAPPDMRDLEFKSFAYLSKRTTRLAFKQKIFIRRKKLATDESGGTHPSQKNSIFLHDNGVRTIIILSFFEAPGSQVLGPIPIDSRIEYRIA